MTGPRRRGRLVGLAARLGAHRWPQSLGLLLAGTALGAPVVGLAVMHQSGVRAIEEGVRGEFGYADGLKVQATASAMAAVEHSPGVTAVRVGSATVATESARTDAPSWSLDNGKAPLGLLVSGRHARTDGEASISRHLAETLDVGLGSKVTVHRDDAGDTRVRVVGITSDPADRNGDLVITVDARPVGTPTYWILPHLPPELETNPGLTASSVIGKTEARLESPPGGVSAVGQAIPVVAALTVLVMLTALVAQVPGARRDVDALQAAGMAARRCWRVVAVWMAALAAAGSAAGAALACLLLRTFEDDAGSALGQRWTGIAVPWLPTVLVVVLPVMIAFIPTRPVEAVIGWLRRDDLPVRGTGRRTIALGGVLLATAGAVLIVLALLATRRRMSLDHPELVGLAGILSAVLGVRLAANGLVGLGRGRASGELARRLAGQLTLGTSAALLVGTACAGYAAWHTHNTYTPSDINTAPQAPGSYLVYEAPAAAADQILARYRAAGGRHTVVHELPDESRTMVRVTTPDLVRCIDAGPPTDRQVDSCWGSKRSTITGPALDPSLPPTEVRVEPDVLDQSGHVGIVRYGSDLLRVEGTEITPAVRGSGLGGNLAGMIMSPDNPLAKKYGLEPSGFVELGLLDFGALDAHDAAQIRGLVAAIAPAALVSDTTTDTSLEEALAISLLAALVGAALALVIQLATCVAVVSGARQLRTAVAAIGVVRAQRMAISLRVIAPAVVSVVASGALVVAVAPRLGYPGDASMGWAWLLPLLAQAVVVAVLGVLLLRAPRR